MTKVLTIETSKQSTETERRWQRGDRSRDGSAVEWYRKKGMEEIPQAWGGMQLDFRFLASEM